MKKITIRTAFYLLMLLTPTQLFSLGATSRALFKFKTGFWGTSATCPKASETEIIPACNTTIKPVEKTEPKPIQTSSNTNSSWFIPFFFGWWMGHAPHNTSSTPIDLSKPSSTDDSEKNNSSSDNNNNDNNSDSWSSSSDSWSGGDSSGGGGDCGGSSGGGE